MYRDHMKKQLSTHDKHTRQRAAEHQLLTRPIEKTSCRLTRLWSTQKFAPPEILQHIVTYVMILRTLHM